MHCTYCAETCRETFTVLATLPDDATVYPCCSFRCLDALRVAWDCTFATVDMAEAFDGGAYLDASLWEDDAQEESTFTALFDAPGDPTLGWKTFDKNGRPTWAVDAFQESTPTLPILTHQDTPTIVLNGQELPMDLFTDRLNLALLSCEKQGIPFWPSYPMGTTTDVLTPLAGDYSPVIPMGVQSSLASDIRYSLAVSCGAFVLAIGSVVFFHHLLF